jgi:hypothetical protein
MLLQTALTAETHLAEGLILKLRCTVKLEKSLTDLVGMRRLTVSKTETDEQLILPLKILIRKRASRCLLLKWSIKIFNLTKMSSYLWSHTPLKNLV